MTASIMTNGPLVKWHNKDQKFTGFVSDFEANSAFNMEPNGRIYVELCSHVTGKKMRFYKNGVETHDGDIIIFNYHNLNCDLPIALTLFNT